MRDSFLFYRNIRDSVKTLPDEIRLKFFDAICDYALDNVEPIFSGMEASLWNMVKFPFDENKKRSEFGKKGGRPKKLEISIDKTLQKVAFENEKAGFQNEEEENQSFENEKSPKAKNLYKERREKIEDISNKNKGREESINEFDFLTRHKFQKNFPNKDCSGLIGITSQQMDLLIEKIKESEFLERCNNISLSWCLNHFDDIVADKYKNFYKKNPATDFEHHNYTKEELDALFDPLDEVEI